jgi:hypothetical protein
VYYRTIENNVNNKRWENFLLFLEFLEFLEFFIIFGIMNYLSISLRIERWKVKKDIIWIYTSKKDCINVYEFAMKRESIKIRDGKIGGE